MRKLTKALLVMAVGAAAAYGVARTMPMWFAPAQQATVDIRDPELIRKGEYLSKVADCGACHTAPGGKPFAGGLGMQTPMGTIYSTNITPDATHGIGNYSYADFERARAAHAAGATYVAFGAMYASPTKPLAPPAPIELIARAKRELGARVACIGGITADNAAPLIDAGADWVAVISDIYQSADAQAQAAKIATLYR